MNCDKLRMKFGNSEINFDKKMNFDFLFDFLNEFLFFQSFSATPNAVSATTDSTEKQITSSSSETLGCGKFI